jgi:hypothetical protein
LLREWSSKYAPGINGTQHHLYENTSHCDYPAIRRHLPVPFMFRSWLFCVLKLV